MLAPGDRSIVLRRRLAIGLLCIFLAIAIVSPIAGCGAGTSTGGEQATAPETSSSAPEVSGSKEECPPEADGCLGGP
jgi:hypothetical protein